MQKFTLRQRVRMLVYRAAVGREIYEKMPVVIGQPAPKTLLGLIMQHRAWEKERLKSEQERREQKERVRREYEAEIVKPLTQEEMDATWHVAEWTRRVCLLMELEEAGLDEIMAGHADVLIKLHRRRRDPHSYGYPPQVSYALPVGRKNMPVNSEPVDLGDLVEDYIDDPEEKRQS